ncbi:terminase large subunit domain-containing protein [Novosphingobium umbonatum]|nr:terminase family protein [Novosphingobium umbonatum]
MPSSPATTPKKRATKAKPKAADAGLPVLAQGVIEVPISRQVNRAQARQARSMYHRGASLTQIAAELGVKYPTVASWHQRQGWDADKPVDVIEDHFEAKIAAILCKPTLDEGDMKRVDFLMRMMERAARIRKFNETGKEGDLNENIGRRNDDKAKKKREEKRKNFLSLEQWQALLDDFHAKNDAYQELWWEQRNQRTRKLLKSRQIGATWYFAREALCKIAEAVIDGDQPRNQIFLSASERQAKKFMREITGWVRQVTGVELKGNPVLFDFNGLHPASEEEGRAEIRLEQVGLYPMSTNSNTAQGETGDFYFDEFFWVQGFARLRKVAAAMATLAHCKRTYFSTPSTKTHEAYAFWSGEEWNKGRGRKDQVAFDVSHKNLRGGAIMPDGSWCQIVTLDDAIAGGAGGRINKEELRTESSEEEFENLYNCQFVDDSESSFPFSRIAPARVDSFYKWRDFSPALVAIRGQRPFGEKPVWIGYDPNKNGRDDAALIVLAPPDEPGKGKFRVLEKHRLNGLDFAGQAAFIKQVAERYNVADISIDTTGHGGGVWEIVAKWFPNARQIEYSVASKTALVTKAQNVFREGRIEFDANWTDLMAALMAIRPALTGSQRGVTYISKRNGEIGHADLAWALLNALSNEPMDVSVAEAGHGGIVRFSK